MKNQLLTLLMYLTGFPIIMIITDLISGKAVNWLYYLKFEIGMIIGAGIALVITFILEKLKLNVYIKITIWILAFSVILGLLIRYNLLNFLK